MIYRVILEFNFLRTFLRAIVRIFVFIIHKLSLVFVSAFVYKHMPTGRQRATERGRSRSKREATGGSFRRRRWWGERRIAGVGRVASRRVASRCNVHISRSSELAVCVCVGRRLPSRDSVAPSLKTVDHVFANIRGARAKRL